MNVTEDVPLVVRPVRLVRVCRIAAGTLVVVFTIVALSLRQGSGAATFQPADQVAMVVLGLLGAAAILTLTRARVEADRSGIRVRNVLGETVLPWGVVRAVRLDEGSSWASLDLQDDDTIALLALQSNDRERAVQAVLALRRLLADAHSR